MEHKPEIKESEENKEKPFFVRPYEEVENSYIDDRGFYTTPNGSFWDEDETYFNRFGFDQYGGSYDKYGVYQPGEGYDEKIGLYDDEKELFNLQDNLDNINSSNSFIAKLREQEKEDEKIIQKYELLFEESEEDSEDISFNDNNIKEAYENCLDKPIIEINNWNEKCYIYDDYDIHDIEYDIEVLGFSQKINLYLNHNFLNYNTKWVVQKVVINGIESNYTYKGNHSINVFADRKYLKIHIIYKESFDLSKLSLEKIEERKVLRYINYGLLGFLHGKNAKISLILKGTFDIVSFEEYFLRKNEKNTHNIEYFWEGTVPYEGKKTLITLSKNKAKWFIESSIGYYISEYNLIFNSIILPFMLSGGNNTILNINISSSQAKSIILNKTLGKFMASFDKIRDNITTFIMKIEFENTCKGEWKVDLTDQVIDEMIPIEDKICKEQLKSIAKSIIDNFNENNKNNDFEFLDYMKIALWIYHNIKYDKKYIGRYEFTALDTYYLKEGCCHQFTKLCNALLYSLGYKVIYAFGLVYDNTPHTWSIIKLNDKWYPLDSTWGIISGKLPVSHIFCNYSSCEQRSYNNIISRKLIA